MEITTTKQIEPKVWVGGVKLIPTYLIWLSYLGDKQATMEIKQIEEYNRSLSNK